MYTYELACELTGLIETQNTPILLDELYNQLTKLDDDYPFHKHVRKAESDGLDSFSLDLVSPTNNHKYQIHVTIFFEDTL